MLLIDSITDFWFFQSFLPPSPFFMRHMSHSRLPLPFYSRERHRGYFSPHCASCGLLSRSSRDSSKTSAASTPLGSSSEPVRLGCFQASVFISPWSIDVRSRRSALPISSAAPLSQVPLEDSLHMQSFKWMALQDMLDGDGSTSSKVLSVLSLESQCGSAFRPILPRHGF